MVETRSGTMRSWWAAIGAAIAVSLGAGGVAFVGATEPAGASAFVPIEPCRIADIRPNTIGPGGTMTFDGWGATGDCDLPTGITGLALNVTAVGATQQTNVRLYPAGTPTPETANLNPSPGVATPNAVDVALNASNGRFVVFNRFGSVAVIIDAMGYYTDHDHPHHHDGRYYTKAQTDTAVDDAIGAASAGLVVARGIVTTVNPTAPIGLSTVDGVSVTTAEIGTGRYTVQVVGIDGTTPPISLITAQSSLSGSIECHTRSLIISGGDTYTATIQCTDDAVATGTSFQFVIIGEPAA